MTGGGTLEELYESLAGELASRVLRRIRNGLVRDYIAAADDLPYVRGRLDVHEHVRRPWSTSLVCTYQEHPADVGDNQILVWTLFLIGRSGICRSERVRSLVHRALRQLQGGISLTPMRASDCLGRSYHRLNQDYAPLHTLCRFFLEWSGPHHTPGERQLVPFLLNMHDLFETCVAVWLRAHLPGHLELSTQHPYPIGTGNTLRFYIDLVIRDGAMGGARCVLDTKHKHTSMPSTDDIAQVITYAVALGCTEAFLIYPEPPPRPFDVHIGTIRVRSVAFNLIVAIPQAGQGLLDQLKDVLGVAY